jgi:hypothetical protein
MEITFNYGKTISVDEMQPGCIYLDGACRGPAIDNEKNSFSFDHHADCLRFATAATTVQVLTALILGLDPSEYTVEINDLDADGSFSLWLLRNPEKVSEHRVWAMAHAIGFVDAHGPALPPEKLHKCLSRNPRVAQTEEMLWEDQAKIDAWYTGGDDALPEPFSFPPCPAFGLTNTGELLEFESVADFAAVYAAGCVVAVLCAEGPAGTTGYTIGKRSDFVSFDVQAFLARMNAVESGWGGGSTIGGAPRRDEGLRSLLTVHEVMNAFLEVAGK